MTVRCGDSSGVGVQVSYKSGLRAGRRVWVAIAGKRFEHFDESDCSPCLLVVLIGCRREPIARERARLGQRQMASG